MTPTADFASTSDSNTGFTLEDREQIGMQIEVRFDPDLLSGSSGLSGHNMHFNSMCECFQTFFIHSSQSQHAKFKED